MRLRRLALSRLRPKERLAVALLRGGEHDVGGSELIGAFGALRSAARAARLSILAVDADLIGDDEQALIGWLSARQRRKPEFTASATPELDQAVQVCAQLLAEAGHRLSFGSQVRTDALLARTGATPESSHMTSERKVVSFYPAASLEARAVRAVALRGTLRTSELAEIGVSRQMVVHLHRRGLLRRVRYGHYALGPAAEDPGI